jgi:hypothetical protein
VHVWNIIEHLRKQDSLSFVTLSTSRHFQIYHDVRIRCRRCEDSAGNGVLSPHPHIDIQSRNSTNSNSRTTDSSPSSSCLQRNQQRAKTRRRHRRSPNPSGSFTRARCNRNTLVPATVMSSASATKSSNDWSVESQQ